MGQEGMEAPLLGNHGLANSKGKSWSNSKARRSLLAFLTVTSQFLFLPSSGFNLIHFLFIWVCHNSSVCESFSACVNPWKVYTLFFVLGFNHNT